jgi:hypothetical protein
MIKYFLKYKLHLLYGEIEGEVAQPRLQKCPPPGFSGEPFDHAQVGLSRAGI